MDYIDFVEFQTRKRRKSDAEADALWEVLRLDVNVKREGGTGTSPAKMLIAVGRYEVDGNSNGESDIFREGFKDQKCPEEDMRQFFQAKASEVTAERVALSGARVSSSGASSSVAGAAKK